MDGKVLLVGAIAAFLILTSKKSSNSKKIEDIEPIDQIPQPKNQPKNQTPMDNGMLNDQRTIIIQQFLGEVPVETNEPDPYGNYVKWKSITGNPSYQDWLTNQIYWTISRLENKTDLFTDFITDFEFPYLLHVGEKASLTKDNKIKIMKFNETEAQANKRLGNGRKLWMDIRNYIEHNLKGCPQIADCGQLFD